MELNYLTFNQTRENKPAVIFGIGAERAAYLKQEMIFFFDEQPDKEEKIGQFHYDVSAALLKMQSMHLTPHEFLYLTFELGVLSAAEHPMNA